MASLFPDPWSVASRPLVHSCAQIGVRPIYLHNKENAHLSELDEARRTLNLFLLFSTARFFQARGDLPAAVGCLERLVTARDAVQGRY